ncbi:agmatinase [Nocardioides sp. LHG3406-4]|uniref:agmatinase n=1 Tax=Nocardioides sp. LHG3406-4 TaxID=2804575 RepID=UPI003CED67D4
MSSSTPSTPPEIVAQADAGTIPRYAGLSTFARLPRLEDVTRYDLAVLGVPFDSGTSYRPGARFGPAHIRQSSRLLRPYNPYQEVAPFEVQQVVDAGDVPCNPFDIQDAIAAIERRADELLHSSTTRLLTLGGDHTIALPLLRSLHRVHGPLALIHFDAHLDTWDTLYGSKFVHGTPFRRAHEEGLLLDQQSAHVGIRSSVYSPDDFSMDAGLGFTIVHSADMDREGLTAILERLRSRIGAEVPVYVSIDIDVLEPAIAPGTGTPELGGLSGREALALLRGLDGLNIVGSDIVEVAPAYDHAELTGVAAANLAYELVSLMRVR